MDGDVPVDDVLAVLGSAYDEFAETYRRESANIGVEYGDNEPDADTPRTLRDYTDHFSYSATLNGDDIVWFDSHSCQTDVTGWQADVNRWYFDGTDSCSTP